MAEPILHIRGPEDFAAAFGVSSGTLDRLAVYEALLRQWQKTINLVAPSTLDAVWHRHFADSAQLLALAPNARTWVDLGSGAGFPGLVVALMLAAPSPRPLPMPEEAWGEGNPPRVTLIDSDTRKCAFLREVARQTEISTRVAVEILSTRIEAAATQASFRAPDVVSARALAPLGRLLDLAAPMFGPGTMGLLLKGKDAEAELKAAEKMWDFKAELATSRTDPGARIIVIRNPALKAKG
jgi:16S rRNA (guanine527-N7)-methyltransferase